MALYLPPAPSTPVSQNSALVTGLRVTTFNLPPPPQTKKLYLIILLHGRTQKQEDVFPYAQHLLSNDLQNLTEGIWPACIAFDHPNHGTRTVDVAKNFAWMEGNPTHAQDMYGIQYSASRDIRLLMDVLPAFLFPTTELDAIPEIEYVPVGISLGGHAVWLALSHDERIRHAVPIIGSANYLSLITGRAELLKDLLANPQKELSFPGYPPAFVEKIVAAIHQRIVDGSMPYPVIPASLVALLKRIDPVNQPISNFKGKKLLILSGEADTLVPWSSNKEFVDKLRQEYPEDIELVLEEGVSHTVTKNMVDSLGRWLKKMTESSLSNRVLC